MKRMLAAVAGLVLLLGGAWLVAQQQSPVEPSERIARLIKDLDSDDFNTRDRASQELEKIGAPAVGPLTQALQGNHTLDFRSRIDQVLRKLAIHEEGGEVVNGLKLRLVASKNDVKLGDSVRFTARLSNMTDQEMTVYVGYSYCGNYFDCGSTYRMKNAGKLDSPRWKVGFCGTGAVPLFVTIPAKTALDYPLNAQLIQDGNKVGYQMGDRQFCFLEASEAGPHVIQVALDIKPEQKKPRGFAEKPEPAPAKDTANYWSGTVTSNPVQLKVQSR